MKDDYLWDKTGEPDSEIEHLERVLGQLRHKRKAGDLPPFEVKVRRTTSTVTRMLAIAATLAFAALALGAFLVFQRRTVETSAPVVMVTPVPSQTPVVQEAAPLNETGAASGQSDPVATTNGTQTSSRPAPAATQRRREIYRSREALSERQEQAAGLMAKEKLIKALQITSSKLDVVQKKIQGPSS